MDNNFHTQLASYVGSKDLAGANRVLMQELGKSLVANKKDFVELLNDSGIEAVDSDFDAQLVDKFIDNVDKNPKLLLGAAFLVNVHNKVMNFDGENEVSDAGVKASYKVMSSHFDGDYSNAGGIGAAIGEVSKLGSKIAEGQQKKKYGASDMLEKKQEARAQLTQSILQQRQSQSDALKAEQENKHKTTRLMLIIGGSVLGVALIGLGIYLYKKR